jgi:ankyrin repeat protein
MIAARLGALDAVELLLAAGATPDAQAAPSEPFMAEVSIASS